MFAQAVYLMFSSVYVCKETIEHLLLSAGGGEGHHHHHGDEEAGLGYVSNILLVLFVLKGFFSGAALIFLSLSPLLHSFRSLELHFSLKIIPKFLTVSVLFVSCPFLPFNADVDTVNSYWKPHTLHSYTFPLGLVTIPPHA